MSLEVTINGRPQSIDVSPDTPLLWVLRDRLQLTGTKFGCGMGVCGACTVHVNGRAIRSCITPIEQVARQRITTIEGLHPQGKHPVQQAWIAEQVPQCGYCQPGQIMGAAALLTENPAPSDADIANAMSGHLCRCGTYPRIMRAIKRAAKVRP